MDDMDMEKLDAVADSVGKLAERFDAFCARKADAETVYPTRGLSTKAIESELADKTTSAGRRKALEQALAEKKSRGDAEATVGGKTPDAPEAAAAEELTPEGWSQKAVDAWNRWGAEPSPAVKRGIEREARHYETMAGGSTQQALAERTGTAGSQPMGGKSDKEKK